MSEAQFLIRRRERVVANGVGVFNTATVDSAKGAIITDTDGRDIIDFAGGIGVVNAGHRPEPVVQAIKDQADKYLHTSFNVVTYEPYVELCEMLTDMFPHGEHTKAMLVSTGAEAVENAIKIARQATGRAGVLCFSDAFHGRTMMAMSLTSSVKYKHGNGPFAPEVYRITYPNYYRYGQGMTEEQFIDKKLKGLHESIKNVVAPENLAAVIIEVVQGEGGFVPAPKRYIEGLREFCDEHGVMLIFDEVQAGFGRTGAWASYDHYGVTPDLSTWAKSMGSGMPISAVLGRADIMDAAKPGTIGGTYIGNPVSCAAAIATIKYMKEIDINAHGKRVGDIIRSRFEDMKAKFDCIGDVRGLGAMMAMEFVKNGDSRQPNAEIAKALVAACAKRDLIVISAGTYGNVIRVLSPLVIDNETLNRGLDIMEAALEEVINLPANLE